MRKTEVIYDCLIILFSSMLSVIGLHTFISPARFAAVGIDGIASMFQALTGINMGYMIVAINIPLMITAVFILNKKYALYTFFFIIVSSCMLIVASKINFYEYHTQYNVWVSVVFSGILHGFRTGMMVKIGGSTGGIDIVASIIQKYKPYLNIENSISVICYFISGLSFFVFGDIESVAFSILHMLVFKVSMSAVMKTTRNAVKVTIITDESQIIKDEILTELEHGATVISCKGVYTNTNKEMIVTIVNIRQMNELVKFSKKHAGTFIYYNNIDGVWGNFRWKKSDPVN